MPSDSEVKKAIFQIGALKSPRLDGFLAKFYQDMWESIRSDIVSLVQDLFTSRYSLKNIDKTFVVYIPKKSNPQYVGDFRRISLCNVIYKNYR